MAIDDIPAMLADIGVFIGVLQTDVAVVVFTFTAEWLSWVRKMNTGAIDPVIKWVTTSKKS